MLILFIFALSLSLKPFPSLLKNTTDLSGTYQQKCLRALPAIENSHGAMASLLCGEKVTDEDLKLQLSKTSLIHIFVVSGSHLLLIDEFLSILRIPFFVRWLFLAAYSVLVGWQAPAVRALGALSTRRIFHSYRLYFPADLAVLLAGFMCLVLFPDWWTSLSFQMSWCASLGLALPRVLGRSSLGPWQRALRAQAFIYLVMLPTLWGWGSLHPLGILINLLVAPLVSLALLPLALATVILPFSLPIFATSFHLFERLLVYLAEPVLLPAGGSPGVVFLWGWIFSLHLLCHGGRIYFRRRQREQR